MPEADMGEHVGEELPVPVPEMDIDRNHRKVIWKGLKDILQDEAGYVDYYQNRRDIYKVILETSIYYCISHISDISRFSQVFKESALFYMITTQ